MVPTTFFRINECAVQYFTSRASGHCHVKNTDGAGGADASGAYTVIFTGALLFEVSCGFIILLIISGLCGPQGAWHDACDRAPYATHTLPPQTNTPVTFLSNKFCFYPSDAICIASDWTVTEWSNSERSGAASVDPIAQLCIAGGVLYP